MNGIIVINKESNMTSFDCVNIAKKVFSTKKIGHTGTLDPLATGVLVLCIDDATKLVPFLESDSKIYEAELTLGYSTTTQDLEGEVVDKKLVSYIEESTIDDVLNSFIGKISQTPSIYSAIKVNGKKLYEYARSNKEVEIPSRNIEIYSIERISDIEYLNNECKFSIRCHVSKGTYIRSLCFDIAARLGYPGVMSKLVRIQSGIFNINDANSLDDLKNNNVNIISMKDALKGYYQVELPELLPKILNGCKLEKDEVISIYNKGIKSFVVTNNSDIVAIYELDSSSERYKAIRVWN